MFILTNIYDFVNTKFYFPIVEFLGKWEVKCGFCFSFGGKIGKEEVTVGIIVATYNKKPAVRAGFLVFGGLASGLR